MLLIGNIVYFLNSSYSFLINAFGSFPTEIKTILPKASNECEVIFKAQQLTEIFQIFLRPFVLKGLRFNLQIDA